MIPRTLLALLACLVVLVATAHPADADPEPAVPAGVWPLSPEPDVVAGFDPPAEEWGAGHRGVDLAGHPGQVVRAALAGRVTFAGVLAGRGVVVVDHGDTRTTYEPVTASVSVGRTVARGAAIGVLTVPLSHCFPAACLHWGWRRGDTYLDPLLLVGRTDDVRLLPLWRDRPVGGSPRSPALPLLTTYSTWRQVVDWVIGRHA